MMNDTMIGLDLAKRVFHVVELNAAGKVIKRKGLRRSQLLAFFAQHPVARVAMEACASSHYWGRELQRLGHHVLLLPPQHVKAYARGQKNDYNDAQAIAEAARHGAIMPVAIRTVAQQDGQAIHRIRSQLIRDRTALCNQVRGLLAERGLVIPQGVTSIRKGVPELLAQSNDELSPLFRSLLQRRYEHLVALDEEIAWHDQQLLTQSQADECCQRLQTLPGIGPMGGHMLSLWLGDGHQFRKGRDASAALGVVPRQHSSGGKAQLLGITKRGDGYLRRLLIQGAHAVLRHVAGKTDRLSVWLQSVKARCGVFKAAVAYVNKLTRMAWALVRSGGVYQVGTV